MITQNFQKWDNSKNRRIRWVFCRVGVFLFKNSFRTFRRHLAVYQVAVAVFGPSSFMDFTGLRLLKRTLYITFFIARCLYLIAGPFLKNHKFYFLNLLEHQKQYDRFWHSNTLLKNNALSVNYFRISLLILRRSEFWCSGAYWGPNGKRIFSYAIRHV